MVFYCVVDQMELTAEDAATFNNTTTKAEIVAPQGSRHSGRPSADDHDIENFSFKVHSGKSECTLFVIGNVPLCRFLSPLETAKPAAVDALPYRNSLSS